MVCNTKTFFLIKILLILFAFLVNSNLKGQQLTQTIRGIIVDKDTQMPLIGVTVQSATKGAITDVNGQFRLANMPLGRHDLTISYIGYEQRIISNIIVNSAKEVILDIALQEAITNLEAVIISASKDKSGSINEMAAISSRQFTVEEAGRYAGSRNEPSRMAQNYAGVSGSSDSRNDIIIRGNSP
jgi:hypothetical protein